MLDTYREVVTPEGVGLHLPAAGPVPRALAWGIDLAIRIGVLMLMGMVLAMLGKVGEGLYLIGLFLVFWAYPIVLESVWRGQTPGKKALGLRVVREGGLPVTLPDALLRNLLRAADLLPPLGPMPSYLVGGLVSASDVRFRRLGDLAAGTFVVVEEPSRLQAPAPVEPPPTPDELRAMPAHLRLKVEERKTLDAFMRRWRSLHPARREEVCEAYARDLARRLALPPPVSGARFLQLVYARLTEADRVPGRRR